jgi:hypothetical protein
MWADGMKNFNQPKIVHGTGNNAMRPIGNFDLTQIP